MRTSGISFVKWTLSCMVYFKSCIKVRLFLFTICWIVSNSCFSQENKYQRNISAYLDSVQAAGALVNDSIGINGERIDSFADFPGGLQAWKEYKRKHYPNDVLLNAYDHGIKSASYIVWVEFIVEEDGSLSNFRSITNFGFGLEQGFIKLIKKSGTWVPALSNGKKIASKIKRSQVFEFQENQ